MNRYASTLDNGSDPRRKVAMALGALALVLALGLALDAAACSAGGPARDAAADRQERPAEPSPEPEAQSPQQKPQADEGEGRSLVRLGGDGPRVRNYSALISLGDARAALAEPVRRALSEIGLDPEATVLDVPRAPEIDQQGAVCWFLVDGSEAALACTYDATSGTWSAERLQETVAGVWEAPGPTDPAEPAEEAPAPEDDRGGE